MLKISREQFSQLQLKNEDAFVNRLVAIYEKEHVQLLEHINIARDDLFARVKEAFSKAQQLNIKEELYVFYFAGLSLEFGKGFLTTETVVPQTEWLESQYVPSKFKIVRLLQLLNSNHFTLES